MLKIENNKLICTEELPAFADDFPQRLRAKAEKLYTSGRFLCAEALVRAFVDEVEARELRPLVAMASGFANGMGNAGCVCGACVGAVMILGALFGRDKPGDAKHVRCQELAKEMHDRFQAMQGGHICCRILNKNLAEGSPEREAQCAKRTGDAAEILALILMRESAPKA